MPEELPRFCQIAVQAALEKKADKVLVLDVRRLCEYTDFIMICHGEVPLHVQAIAQHITEKMADHLPLHHIEGFEAGQWVILDYYDLVIHIFDEPHRYYYDLETFWVDAPHWWFRDDGTPVLMAPTAGAPGVL